jgi:hypothetical protein
VGVIANPEPKTDTTVLGRYYLLASDEELEAAIKALQFELKVRADRRDVPNNDAERLASVRAEIDAIDAVYDHAKDGL